ncbi:hypothetical protein ACQEVZ_57560 [Dactylosporangium sp. CA-152071]|uniref:hypothetical protein n=1 Tax=Dactylosporangium sp. CA-152071 TaxID=3239933 RepID=UPI003D94C52E
MDCSDPARAEIATDVRRSVAAAVPTEGEAVRAAPEGEAVRAAPEGEAVRAAPEVRAGEWLAVAVRRGPADKADGARRLGPAHGGSFGAIALVGTVVRSS